MSGANWPTLDFERELLREVDWVIGLDEVGRGALAGPVAVGAVAVSSQHAAVPMLDGVRDSKLVAEKKRGPLAIAVNAWAEASAVGWATPREIDDVGITQALGLAAWRALDEVRVGLAGTIAVILDGNHDYLSRMRRPDMRIIVRIKADRDCGSVAAASLVAKVARDELMVALDEAYPDYEWRGNKGYGSATHRRALATRGVSEHHRLSWHLVDEQLF